MATFEVLVRTIDKVEDHPNADRLSICHILGYMAITAKVEDEQGNLTHRHSVGDAIVYVPEAALISHDVLRLYGFWDKAKDCGMLAGKDNNRVKAIRLRSVLSQGLVWPTSIHEGNILVEKPGFECCAFNIGDDVSDFLGITKWEPAIPLSMSGEVASVHEFSLQFDIENEQNFPGFLDDDEVEVTEKLHGTNCRIAFRPGLNHEEMFGKDGNVGISSKGLGAKGIVFKNNEANINNIYVKTLREAGIIDAVDDLGRQLNTKIDLFGEIFGQGVQDLHYGQTSPTFAAFDIAVNGEYLSTDEKVAMFDQLGVTRVPVLYRGAWDRDLLVKMRDGKTTLGQGNVKEGIVVTAIGDQSKREISNHRLRPFLKMINPDYLLRKGETTEYS